MGNRRDGMTTYWHTLGLAGDVALGALVQALNRCGLLGGEARVARRCGGGARGRAAGACGLLGSGEGREGAEEDGGEAHCGWL